MRDPRTAQRAVLTCFCLHGVVESAKFLPATRRMIHPLLYEINTRCWLRRLSDEQGRAVTLADVPEEEIGRWQNLGFTHVWAMGVWTTGPRARAQALENPAFQKHLAEILPGWTKRDVPGSPYAIGAYEIPALLGGSEGLKIFRRQLHARGMKLLLDFVPNHLGLDHPWVSEKPERFVQSDRELPGTFLQQTREGVRRLAHGRDPNFAPWSDTVQLDYRRTETRAAMIEVLQSVAAQSDGVQCDMAMLLLNDIFRNTWAHFPEPEPMPAQEFWKDAIGVVRKSRPDFIFLAEVYWGLEARLQELGFDYTYGKTVYDRLVDRHYAALHAELLAARPDWLSRCVHFLENHDERRAASVFSPEEHRAAALLMLGLPGARMIYEGQLRGAKIRTSVHLSRWPNEPVDAQISAMYKQMLLALKGSAVGHGDFRLLATESSSENLGAENFVVVQWQNAPDEFELVVVNLCERVGECRARPVIKGLGLGNWQMRDLLGSEIGHHHGGDLEGQGIQFALPAHGGQLLHFVKSVR
ncbi:MAG TPA: alpha-amylase family glycosyl hydrolase [Verrucomicrobiae bacterium]|nr:alpha-amylase family glycosyl hydrolase [Verrucomicrobiae bacterium]